MCFVIGILCSLAEAYEILNTFDTSLADFVRMILLQNIEDNARTCREYKRGNNRPLNQTKARKFVSLYLEPKRIGNRIYVERSKLEALLHDPNRSNFPLNL